MKAPTKVQSWQKVYILLLFLPFLNPLINNNLILYNMNKIKCIVCDKNFNVNYIAKHHETNKHINNLKKYKENKKKEKNNNRKCANICLIF